LYGSAAAIWFPVGFQPVGGLLFTFTTAIHSLLPKDVVSLTKALLDTQPAVTGIKISRSSVSLNRKNIEIIVLIYHFLYISSFFLVFLSWEKVPC